jgi:predicted neuraminidase
MTIRCRHIVLIICGVLAACGRAAALSPVVKSEFVFEQAPFPSAHASTIAETPGGLIAAWFGGTRERNPDVGIWVSRQREGAWEAPVEVANGIQAPTPDGKAQRFPCWNPVLFQPAGAPLMLFYKVGPSPAAWWGEVKTSDDHGATWSGSRKLPAGMLRPIKDKPVQLANGDVLCPSSTEDHGWRVHFERFHELDGDWLRTPALNGSDVSLIQPTVLSLGGDKLMALARSRQQKIYQASSADGGMTWTRFTPSDLPNPGSGIDAVTLADGRHLLVYNHTTDGRTPLNLALSADGMTWRAALLFENEPGEYSYPAIIQTRDGLVHVTYTWKRRLIKHVVVDPRKLEPREFEKGTWPASINTPAKLTAGTVGAGTRVDPTP